jgi:peptidoglycan/xylan/chitin deacetylase (PgdA/CDA1 family)
MRVIVRFILNSILLNFMLCGCVLASDQVKVAILTYHRFGPTVADSMTVKTTEFESQLKWLKDNHFSVIPLRTLVNYFLGEGAPPPAKSVIITADDGHKSVFTDMQPLVKKYNVPVTLFIYPSAISNASYAMTWDQLQKLKQTGLFDIQGHTYWHPNFKKDKKRLQPVEYQKFVEMQLSKSKAVLEKKMGIKVDLLAWPFGIYDDELEKEAKKDGYLMAFSIDGRCASKSEKAMAQPRYMIVNGYDAKKMAAIVANCVQTGPKSE